MVKQAEILPVVLMPIAFTSTSSQIIQINFLKQKKNIWTKTHRNCKNERTKNKNALTMNGLDKA